MPNSASSGSMKVWNMSSTRPRLSVLMICSTSRSTSVTKTIGRWPSLSCEALISRTTWCALSTLSMNGRRTCLGLAENWLRIELPKVSAVMPVPSDTKYTVRMAMAVSGGARCGRGSDGTHPLPRRAAARR